MNAILAACVLAAGQVPPPDPMFFPESGEAPPKVRPAGDAEVRKEARDAAVKKVGDAEGALAFTKFYGDLGVHVLQRCRPETGRALVALHGAGVLGRMKDARAVLQAVRLHAEPAGAWLAAPGNAERMMDAEALQLWVRTPLDYAYDLRDLEAEAAEMRSGVRHLPRLAVNAALDMGTANVAVVVLLASLAALVFVKRKQASA